MSRKKDLYDMATAGTININNVKIDNHGMHGMK